MKPGSLLIVVLLLFTAASMTFQDKVTLEVIHENGKEEKHEIVWPYGGPQPVGMPQEVMIKVNKLLSDNNIDCPPKRMKISDNIWKCGNGKKIKTTDNRLARLLSKAWDEK